MDTPLRRVTLDSTQLWIAASVIELSLPAVHLWHYSKGSLNLTVLTGHYLSEKGETGE
jgi:hypothetical protein